MEERPLVIGLDDMAVMFDLTKGGVENWRVRNLLPAPYRTVGRTPVWLYGDVEAWAEETGRTIKQHITL